MLQCLLAFLAIFQSQDTLDLSNCRHVKKIKQKIEAFDASGFKSIILDCNNLNDIEKFDFRTAEYLKLSLNPLTSLSTKFSYDSLKHLDITNTLIYDFPRVLCQSHRLNRIDSYGSSLSKVPPCFSDLESLEVLNVDFIKIDTFITLNRSKLKNISVAFGKNSEINIRTMEQIGKMNYLTRLCLIDADFFHLEELKNKDQIESLSLMLTNDTGFCEIISKLAEWKKLQVLELGFNTINTVPVCLSKLKNVKTLILKSPDGNGKMQLVKNSLNLGHITTISDFANIQDFDVDKGKISIIVESPNRAYRYKKMGFKVEYYINPIYIR